MKPHRFTTTNIAGTYPLVGIGFKPSVIKLTVAGNNSATQSGLRWSHGVADGNIQTCQSLDGTTTPQTHFDRVINLGTPSGAIVASFVSFDPDGFTLFFLGSVPGYPVSLELYP